MSTLSREILHFVFWGEYYRLLCFFLLYMDMLLERGTLL